MRFLFAFFVLCSVCSAEIVATVTQAKAITGLVGQRAAGDVTLIDASSKPVIQSVTLVKITTPAKFVDVVARRFVVESGVVKIESATVKEIGTREYLLVGSGVYGVEIVAFDPVSGIDRKMVDVRIDETKPEPKPEPTPDVPTDQFDNLGQRVANLSAGLPKRLEVGAIYRKYSIELVSNPSIVITAAMEAVGKERLALLGADGPKYNEITNMLNADVQSRWPMSKGVLSEYMACVAKGYGAK